MLLYFDEGHNIASAPNSAISPSKSLLYIAESIEVIKLFSNYKWVLLARTGGILPEILLEPKLRVPNETLLMLFKKSTGIMPDIWLLERSRLQRCKLFAKDNKLPVNWFLFK